MSTPPYGSSINMFNQIGFQLNHKINKFFGSNVFSIGIEYNSDYVMDEILAYNYLIDQRVNILGTFLHQIGIFLKVSIF